MSSGQVAFKSRIDAELLGEFVQGRALFLDGRQDNAIEVCCIRYTLSSEIWLSPINDFKELGAREPSFADHGNVRGARDRALLTLE